MRAVVQSGTDKAKLAIFLAPTLLLVGATAVEHLSFSVPLFDTHVLREGLVAAASAGFVMAANGISVKDLKRKIQ